MALDFTRLSEKGQVVIPSELRRKMKLKEGTRFVILGQQDTIVLRRIEISSEKRALRKTLQRFRGAAQKSGFTGREIERLIKDSRKKSAFDETHP
jgi:AbrB family looped-hinge helix DNA binding protein